MGALDGLTGAYRLTPAFVKPSQLLLDPNNPRLVTSASQVRSYAPEEIQAAEVQQRILESVCKKEHDVRRLIDSIGEIGFIGGLHEMVVKPLSQGGPYLVLEGNRRTAAIQHLLRDPIKLRPDVKNSLDRIEVKVFDYIPNSLHDEEKVVNVLLETIHIDGPREWGALERASYVSRTYFGLAGDAAFPFNLPVAREVAERFKQSVKGIRKAMVICRTYEQLKKAYPDLSSASFSLIDLATSTRAVAQPYFELDSDMCQLSEKGVERFVELVLAPNPPVHNPKLFRQFAEIFEDGTPYEVEQIVSRERPVEQVIEALRRRKERRAFRSDLETIREKIDELRVADFNGTEAEKTLIRSIHRIVDKRLLPLLG